MTSKARTERLRRRLYEPATTRLERCIAQMSPAELAHLANAIAADIDGVPLTPAQAAAAARFESLGGFRAMSEVVQ